MEGAGESRDRMIAQAMRQSLVQDIERANKTIPAAAAVMLTGMLIVIVVWIYTPGLVLTVLGGGIGMILIPMGIALLGKALAAIRTSKRKIRELDTRQLPSARVV
jgi:hypothetical protein